MIHPYALRQKLADCLVGCILQDYHWPDGDPRWLAPCCGRRVDAIRWLWGNGHNHILVIFEPPQFPDEPPALLIPAGTVSRVSGGEHQISLWGKNGNRFTMGIAPCNWHRPI